MPIDLPKEARQEATASIDRYFQDNFDGPIGGLAAGRLLDFFLEEVGPCVYNRAVAEVQARLLARVADLENEVFEDEFQYWRRPGRRRAER